MYDQVVGWIVEHSIGLGKQSLQRLGQVLKHVRGRVFKGRFMAPRQDPGLEGESRSVGRDGEKVFVLGHHTCTSFGLLTNDVAENAALLVDVILLGAFQFLHHVDRKNG